MKVMVTEIRDIPEKYKFYMSNDGQLIGQEKSNLVSELTDILSSLVYLIYRIPFGKISRPTLSVETIGFRLSASINESDWTGQGQVGPALFKTCSSFAQMYQQDLTPRLQRCVKEFAVVGLEKTPDLDKIKGFYESIQEAMATTLGAVYGLQYLDWKK